MKTTNTICIGGVSLIIGENATTQIPGELIKSNCQKPLVVTDSSVLKLGLCDSLFHALSYANMTYVTFSDVPSDPPSQVVAQGTSICKENNCDSVIAIGGGSVLDCAKAIKMMATHTEGTILDYVKNGLSFINPGLPLFSVPTTSGTGSEVTQYAVITDETKHIKTTIGDTRLVSKAAFLDPTLTKSLPPHITATTALDAMAHAIEAYTSNRVLEAGGSTAFSDALDLEAIRLIAHALPTAVSDGSNLDSRKDVMVGATMAGLVSQAGSGAAHGIGTGLGALYHVPHGEAVGIFLPYVMEYNIKACPKRFAQIAQALGVDITGMSSMEAALCAVTHMKKLLKEINFKTLDYYVKTIDEIPYLAKVALVDHCNALNAIVLDQIEECQDIITKAWYHE